MFITHGRRPLDVSYTIQCIHCTIYNVHCIVHITKYVSISDTCLMSRFKVKPLRDYHMVMQYCITSNAYLYQESPPSMHLLYHFKYLLYFTRSYYDLISIELQTYVHPSSSSITYKLTISNYIRLITSEDVNSFISILLSVLKKFDFYFTSTKDLKIH